MRNLLSMAGRVTLIKSVLTSISIHVMTVLPIPKKILMRMESLLANFLWDHGSSRSHHWVNFENICRPKDAGGWAFANFMTISVLSMGNLLGIFCSNRVFGLDLLIPALMLIRMGLLYEMLLENMSCTSEKVFTWR